MIVVPVILSAISSRDICELILPLLCHSYTKDCIILPLHGIVLDVPFSSAPNSFQEWPLSKALLSLPPGEPDASAFICLCLGLGIFPPNPMEADLPVWLPCHHLYHSTQQYISCVVSFLIIVIYSHMGDENIE